MPKGSRKVKPRKVASSYVVVLSIRVKNKIDVIGIEKSRQQRIQKRQQSNPFNHITTKNLRNSVLGQRVKGNVKRPGHSISRSIEKRKRSLLSEYNAIESNQSNTFIDNRYSKALESKLNKMGKLNKMNRDKKSIEKMIKKLTSQRLKSNKLISYNLDDSTNENNDFTLTHLGAPIDDKLLCQNKDGLNLIDDDEENNKYLYRGFSKENIYKMIKEKSMSFEQIAESANVCLNRSENKTKPQIIKRQILESRYKKCKQQIENESVRTKTDLNDDKFRQTKDWLFENRNKKNEKNESMNNKEDKYAQKLIEFEADKRSGVCDKTLSDLQRAQNNFALLTKMEKKRRRNALGLPSDSEDDIDIDLDGTKDEKYNFVNDDKMDQNMQKLEKMFDRAQKGYDDGSESVSDGENEGIKVLDEQNDTNWEKILEEVAESENESGSEYEEGDNENSNDLMPQIDAEFIPKKKRDFRLFDEDNSEIESEYDDENVQIGAEPAGKGEMRIFDLVKKRENEKKKNEKMQKQKKKKNATADFDNLIDSKKGIKRKRAQQQHHQNEDKMSWNVLKLEESDSLIGNALNDVPFTLDIPSNIEEFEELMNGKSASQQITLLKRMRCANHIKLDENNKPKIIRLYDFLLDYFRKLCVNFTPTQNDKPRQSEINFFQNIDVITRALFALSHDVSEYAYSAHIKKLEIITMHIQKNHNLKHDDKFNGAKDPKNAKERNLSFMPSGYALFYLKLLSHIFPKQNKANPIISAILLILCKCITDIPVNGPRDICCYLFCISLILEIIQKEKRYVPEVIHSLHNLLRCGFLCDEDLEKNAFDLLRETDDLYFTFKQNSNIWDKLWQIKEGKIKSMAVPIRWIFLKKNDEKIFDLNAFKIQSLYSCLTLIFKANQIWNSLLAYSEIFKPFVNVLSDAKIKENICKSNAKLSELHKNLLHCLSQRIRIQSMTRKPLQLIHRAKAIPSLEPDFDPDLKPSFLRLKVRNVTALEKKQKRILKKAIKKQQKAVMNEFRKDTEFIMNEKTKNRIDADNKRHAKWQHEWHHLTEQQRDTNSFQMVGKKLKKKLMKEGTIRGF